MSLKEVLEVIEGSALIRIMNGKEVIFSGYRGMVEKINEGQVVKIRQETEIYKREQMQYGLHSGEIRLTERIKLDDMYLYNLKDLTLKLIMTIYISKK